MALWFEITASVAPAEVEQVAQLMRAVSPGGVTIDEPVDILGPEMGFRVRRDEPVNVRIYLPSSELGAILTEQLRRLMEAHPHIDLIAKPVYQEDWETSWREFFGVVDYGGRVVIVPSWIEHEPARHQVVIRLDPGQAFGTGHHETTRMCLAALEELVRPGDRVLDVGTGSGVLAIAAVKLGATQLHAVDIDPIAVEVARENCQVNRVASQVTLAAGTIQQEEVGVHDLVVANISTAANCALAPVFASAVVPDGTLVLSGILARDAREVTDVMTAAGFVRERMTVDGEWCLLSFRRKPLPDPVQ